MGGMRMSTDEKDWILIKGPQRTWKFASSLKNHFLCRIYYWRERRNLGNYFMCQMVGAILINIQENKIAESWWDSSSTEGEIVIPTLRAMPFLNFGKPFRSCYTAKARRNGRLLYNETTMCVPLQTRGLVRQREEGIKPEPQNRWPSNYDKILRVKVYGINDK